MFVSQSYEVFWDQETFSYTERKRQIHVSVLYYKCVCLYLETFLSESVDHLMVTIREKPKPEALLEVHLVFTLLFFCRCSCL